MRNEATDWKEYVETFQGILDAIAGVIWGRSS